MYVFLYKTTENNIGETVAKKKFNYIFIMS